MQNSRNFWVSFFMTHIAFVIRICKLPCQIYEHMLEYISASHNENHILDELDDSVPKLGKVLALLQETVVIRLHLAMLAQ